MLTSEIEINLSCQQKSLFQSTM